jgi:hypothetical protein
MSSTSHMLGRGVLALNDQNGAFYMSCGALGQQNPALCHKLFRNIIWQGCDFLSTKPSFSAIRFPNSTPNTSFPHQGMWALIREEDCRFL